MNGIVIILCKPFPHFAGCRSNNWVRVEIIIRGPAKRFDPNGAFFQFIAFTIEGLTHDVLKKQRITAAVTEQRAALQSLQLLLHGFRRYVIEHNSQTGLPSNASKSIILPSQGTDSAHSKRFLVRAEFTAVGDLADLVTYPVTLGRFEKQYFANTNAAADVQITKPEPARPESTFSSTHSRRALTRLFSVWI